jgi:DNA polymerase-3 subunit delta'
LVVAKLVDQVEPSISPYEPIPPWLDSAWRRLVDAQRHARLGQSLMFSGPRGIGKRLVADRLARLLLCSAAGADGDSCGTCANCTLSDAGHHPDLLVLAPDADAASSEIRAEQVRQLCARETLTPMRGSTKVLKVVPADAMNLFAASSLLKTLEEPAESTLWILITEQPQRLSQTIRSRCQQISFPMPPASLALPWLQSRLAQRASASGKRDAEASSDRAAQCLALAQGAPLRALALAQTSALEQRQRLLDDMVAIAREARDPLAVANDWQRLEPSIALAVMIDVITDLLRLSVDPDCKNMINLAARQSLATLVDGLEVADGHQLLQTLLREKASIDAPVNKQILFEALMVRWQGLFGAPA